MKNKRRIYISHSMTQAIKGICIWHHYSFFLLVIVVISISMPGCGTLATWDMTPGEITPTHFNMTKEVDAIAGSMVSNGQTPGLVVGLLLRDGSTRFFGYGTTEQGGGVIPGPDTLFAIGSLSKGFLGAVAASLVQEGKLAWIDTLSTLLPSETSLSPDAAKISLEQLAAHISGLPRQPFSLRTLAYFIQYLFTGDNFYRHLDHDTVMDYLANFSANSTQSPQYSNIGYGIMGYVLECQTGQSVDTMLFERITGPLGLTHTGYTPEELPGFAMRARGHAGDQPKIISRGQPVPDWHFTDIMRGSAAIYSTARDLLNFAAAHYRRDGSSLSTALTDTLKVRYPSRRNAAAVAWTVDDLDGMHITYQVGIVAGYTSYIGLNADNGTAVVVLQNAFNWDYSVGHKLMVLMAGR